MMQTFRVENIELFKKKALQWMSAFETFCVLNSNHFYSPYSSFDFKIAAGARKILHTDGSNPFDQLKKFNSEKSSTIFGYLTYDLKNDIEKLKSENKDFLNFPLLHFFEPEYLITINDVEIEIECFSIYNPNEVFLQINSTVLNTIESNSSISFQTRISKDDYLKKVEQIIHHILEGNVYELNLCQEFYSENSVIDPLHIYYKLNEASPMPFSAFYRLNNLYAICASPERFLNKKGSKLLSQPIKGTARRSNDPELDEKIKLNLQNDKKERAENVMIVDLVRNDLSKSSKTGTVQVEELFGIYSFTHLHQMISTVSSEIKNELDPIDAISNAFPMGSMTGAPKISAMQIIEELEESKRGLYSGAIGYIDMNNDFDLNVVIRTILYNASANYISFHVGSAITYDSVGEMEYEECLLKAKAMLGVLR